MSALEPWFLELLACPRCHTKVVPTPQGDGLLCPACRVVYPIEDGIPQMLPESGRPVDAGDAERGG